MSDDNKFIPGLRAFQKHHNAPDWILCDVSIEREVLKQWLETNHTDERYIKAQLKVSQGGQPYFAINDFKPQSQQAPQQTPSFTPTPEPSQDMPF